MPSTSSNSRDARPTSPTASGWRVSASSACAPPASSPPPTSAPCARCHGNATRSCACAPPCAPASTRSSTAPASGSAAFEQAETRIADYDAFIEQPLTPCQPQLDLLMTLPGIDHSAARAILIEPGPDMQVFPSSRHCAAWAGLCPGNNESAGKRRHGTTRKGNPFLRTLLIECAHGAARTKHCQFQGYHKALTVRRGYKRATVATAHKLLRILYRMPATDTPYRDPHTNYEALMVKHNAPRWFKMLEKYGYYTPDGATALPDAA